VSRIAELRSSLRVAATAIGICLLLIPATAWARPHRQGIHIDVLGCITGNTDLAVGGNCRIVPGAGEGEGRSGLAGVVALLPGTEGKSLYAVGNQVSALTRIALGPRPGRLVFGACFTGDSFLRECTNVPGAQANAAQSPIANPTAAAISPDGRSLYVTSGDFHDATVARFSRDPASGDLAYVDCISGDRGAGPAGTGACALIASATRSGYGSGLDEPSGIAISADGSHVYVTAALDHSVAVFARSPLTGALEFKQCVSSSPRAPVCAQVKGDRVLDEVTAPLISADGRFLYTAAERAGTIDTFAINGDGGIKYLRCLTGATGPKGCERGGPATGGPYTLQVPSGLLETPDRRFVYATNNYGSIVVLKRSRATGRLSPASCISGFAGDRGKCTLVPHSSRLASGTSLYGVHTPILSRNGKILFVAVRGEDGVTELRRDPRSGALSFFGCVTGNLRLSTAGKGVCSRLPGATANGIGSGYYKTGVLARGPGNLLYAAAPRDSTVLVLRP
jgi:DNA-binding beta-propeller fold protein YncE